MAKRKLTSKSIDRVERMYHVWQYLRRNSDSRHKITQAAMRRDPDIAGYIGDKQTFTRLIKDMARAMNVAEYGYKDESEWKINFNSFNNLVEEENEDEKPMRLTGLYYNRTFSYDEIDYLIEGILSLKTIDTKTADKLIEKIEQNLTTKFYKRTARNICKVKESSLVDKDLLKDNLRIIQQAINDGVQIAFFFNGYSSKKKLEPLRKGKDVVSPYYIVANGGKYYLIACKVRVDNNPQKNMSIWRIDLMTDIEIPGINDRLRIKGKPIVPKRDVKNLPLEWNESFQLEHLNMSFDNPEWITLRIKGREKQKNPTSGESADLTFVHDWFGDGFEVRQDFGTLDYIVRVKCSPYAMVNWALQYSDRVEVLEPESVRKQVVKKIESLCGKYRVQNI